MSNTTHSSISVTEAAANRICDIGGTKSLRIAVKGGGCSGFQYEFGLDGETQADDIVIERSGARVLIDKMSLGFISGSTLDFVDDLMGQSFRIANPQAKSSCGCGTSFSL